jgi:DNA repair protein SbcC/Rad50
MILRRLRLKNYRKYGELEMEFPTGVIGIIGRNGAGKTSLLEAVAFALYGSEASRTRAKGIRRDSAGSDETCEVELELALDGEPYRIIRSLRGATESQQATMYRGSNPVPIATQASGVQVAVRKLLGMDFPTFTRSVFSRQREVNALSDARPEERRQAIRRMVGIETISRAREMAKAERRTKEAQIEGAKQALEVLPSRRNEIKSVKQSLRVARASVIEEAQRAGEAVSAVQAARMKLKRLEKKRLAHENIEKEVSGLAGDLRGAEKSAQKLREDLISIDRSESKLSELKPMDREFPFVRRQKESLDKASGKHDERVRLEREVDSLSARAAAAKEELGAAIALAVHFRGAARAEKSARAYERKTRAALAKLQKERGAVQQQLGQAQSQARKASQAFSNVRKLGPQGECPTCYRKLGDSFEEILAHLKEERDSTATVLATVRKRFAALGRAVARGDQQVEGAVRRVEVAAKHITNAARTSEKLKAKRQEYAQITRTIREKSARITTLSRVKYDEAEHQAIQKRYEELLAIHDEVEGLRNVVSRRPVLRRELSLTIRQAKRLSSRIATMQRRKAALGFNPSEYSSARTAMDAAQAADKAAALAHAKARSELSKLQEGFRRLRDEIRHLVKLQEQINKDEVEVRYLTRVEALLDGFRNELINRVRPEIEQYASSLLDRTTDGRYSKIVLDEDYNIFIHDGPNAYPIRRFSGGEEDLINLCLRIAISQVVSRRAGADTVSLIVLDEVFASQDIERRERILQALGRLQEMFQQVVVITHTEDTQDRIPNVLHVTENARGEAEVAWA